MVGATIAIGILKTIGIGIATDIAKEKVKYFFKNHNDKFKQELTIVINDTLEAFKVKYKVDHGTNAEDFSFLDSQGLINNLLKFSFFRENKINLNSGLEEYEHIIKAKEEEVKCLLEIFHDKINQNEELRSLEISNRFDFIISRVYEEVKEISSEVKLLTEELNKKASTEISGEFSRILSEYESDIMEFKPKSALKHLLSLKNSMENNGGVNHQLLSKVNHLIGRAYSDVFNKNECAKHYIMAYDLTPTSPHYKMYGAIGFLQINEIVKCLGLIEEILLANSLNYRAQAIKSSLVPEYFSSLSNYIVENSEFKYYYAIHLFNESKYSEAFNLSKDDFNKININNITANNYQKVIFYGQLNFYKFFEKNIETALFSWKAHEEEIETLDYAITAFSAIFEKLMKSELDAEYVEIKFFLIFAKYSKSGDPSLVDKLLDVYKILPDHIKQPRCENMSLVLSQNLRNSEALLILENANFGSSTYNLLLASKLSTALNDVSKTKTYLNKFVINSSEFNDQFLQAASDYLNTYSSVNEGKDLINTIKKSIPKEQFIFLEGIYEYSISRNPKTEKFQELIENLNENDDLKKRIVAIILFGSQDLESALSVIDKVNPVDFDSFNVDLLIEILYRLNIQHNRLLEILEKNRSFKTRPHWLEIELNLKASVSLWDEVVLLSKKGLEYYPKILNFVEFLIFGLFKTKREEEIEAVITNYKDEKEWTQNSAFQIASVLIRCDLIDLALDITYSFANERDNTTAREQYAFGLGLAIKKNDKYVLNEIKKDTFIDVKINDNQRILEVTENSIKNNPTISHIKDWNPGQTGKLPTGESIELVLILAKKYGLIRQIIHDIGEREDVGYTSKSFSIDKENPGGIFQQLKDFAGPQEKNRKKELKSILDSYNKGEQNYSFISQALFGGNYLDAYNFLTGTNSKFIVKPNLFFRAITFDPDAQYILDWSSILLFFYLEKEGTTSFQNDFFIISHYIIEDLEEIIYRETEFPAIGTFHFGENDMTPIFHPNNSINQRLDYFNNVHEWILKRCVPTVVPEKLELLEKLKKNKNSQNNMSYFIDTLYLANRDKHILISDDAMWESFNLYGFSKQISTQFYLSNLSPSEWNKSIAEELLKLNYLGITINHQILISTYSDLSDYQARKFTSALKNMPVKVGMNSQIVSECLEFIKYLYLLDIDLNTKKRVSMQVFTFAIEGLKVINMKKNIEALILIKFISHEDFMTSVLEDFRSVI